MAFALAAGIGAIGSIVGGLFGSSASKSAAQAQAQAAEVAAMVQENAITAQQQEIQQAWNFLAPYRGIGQQAAATLGSMTGVGGNPQTSLLTAPFRPTMAQLAATPGYQFTLQQGELATQNALSGAQPGGAAAKSLVNYAEGLAGTTFQQQFQNYLAQNQQIYSMLSGQTGMGENAAAGSGTIGQAGMSNIVSSLGNVGNLITGAGAAQAAGTIGSANAVLGGINSGTNALTNAIGMSALSSALGSGGAGGYQMGTPSSPFGTADLTGFNVGGVSSWNPSGIPV